MLYRFASDTAHFCVHTYNVCGKASALRYGEEQSLRLSSVSIVMCILLVF